jgi:hypothetical protein
MVTEPKALGNNADIDATLKIYAFEPRLLEVEVNMRNLCHIVSAQAQMIRGISEDICI